MRNLVKHLIVSNVIIATLLIATNVIYYNKYTSYKSELAEYKASSDSLEEKIISLSNSSENKEEATKAVSKNFVNAFFNYTAKTQNQIYENIKPYATEKLVNQLKPKSEFDPDTDFKVSISDIKLYYEKVDSNNVSILCFANQTISVRGEGTPTPILLELKLTLSGENWLVNEISINSVKNTSNK